MYITKIYIEAILTLSILSAPSISIQNNTILQSNSLSLVYIQQEHKEDSTNIEQSKENKETSGTNPVIYCLGDSITQGIGSDIITFPDILSRETGYKCYNMGVGGDTTVEIALRSGAIKLYTSSDVIVKNGIAVISIEPENKTYFDSNTYTERNLYNFWHYTEDIAGTIGNVCLVDDSIYKIEALSTVNNKYIIYGEDKLIKKGTEIKFNIPSPKCTDVIVVEMGSNGGWNTYSQLVNQFKDILNHYTNLGLNKFIIVGDTDDPDDSFDTNQTEFSLSTEMQETLWEKALREEFNDNFINMRQYMLTNGLTMNGLEQTKLDKDRILTGRLPHILRCTDDNTHLSDYGYYTMGIGIYEKGKELGYW